MKSSSDPHYFPSGSSERWLRVLRLGGHPIFVIFLLWLIMEAWIGLPALRLRWESRTYDARDMYRCELLTCAGERVDHLGYAPYLTFVKTDRTLGRFLWRKVCEPFRR